MIRLERKIGGESIIVESHDSIHFDEIVGLFLAEKFATPEFVKKYCSDGVLILGINGSQFDEHPINGKPLKEKGECCATLVAKALGVEDDPAIEKILKFAVNVDLKGVSHPFDLSSIIKLLHQRNGSNPEKIIQWAMIAVEAKYQEQLQFFSSTKQEFDKKAEIEDVKGPRGKIFKMVTIVSDDVNISKFARSSYGCKAAIIIQKQSSGNIQIYTNKQAGLVLYDTAQMLRLAEQEAKGQVMVDDWKKLASEGKVEGAEEWYFHHAGQMLLNGSLTAKNVLPTKLALEQIKNIVKVGINPNRFESERAVECQRGICTSTFKDKCPWFRMGLHRCRKIRYEMKKG